MKNNIMKFGDLYRKQVSGTAMGKPPAPSWATIYEGLREIKLLPRWEEHLPLFMRYIDDDIGGWALPADTSNEDASALWENFKAEMNDGCLQWEFSKLSKSVAFLDMKVKITPSGRLTTSLYEKPMALYLFIPPNSAHPPGTNVGHIMGNVLRIFCLNSDERDIKQDTVRF